MNAVDTNILIYAHDPRDAAKQNRAVELIASLVDGVLLWQVACEYIAASRKLEAYGLSRAQVWADLHDLRDEWRFVIPTPATLESAEALMVTGNLSVWDALLVAACVESGAMRLYSEDFDASISGATGIEIINPFE